MAQAGAPRWHVLVIAALLLLHVLTDVFAAVSSSDTNRDVPAG